MADHVHKINLGKLRLSESELRDLLERATAKIYNAWRQRLYQSIQEGGETSFGSTYFYGGILNAIKTQVNDTSAKIWIDSGSKIGQMALHKYFGGTVSAKNAEWLAIPFPATDDMGNSFTGRLSARQLLRGDKPIYYRSWHLAKDKSGMMMRGGKRGWYRAVDSIYMYSSANGATWTRTSFGRAVSEKVVHEWILKKSVYNKPHPNKVMPEDWVFDREMDMLLDEMGLLA